MEIKVIAHYIDVRDDIEKKLRGSLSIELPELGIQLKSIFFCRIEDRFFIVNLDRRKGTVNGTPCKYTTFRFKSYKKNDKFSKDLQLACSIYLCEKVLNIPLMQFEYFQKLAKKEMEKNNIDIDKT